MYLTFVVPLLTFFVVLLFIAKTWSDVGDLEWFPAFVAAFGAYGLVMVWWARNRRLTLTSLETVAGSYKSHLFLGIAFAESPALMGFVGAFVMHKLWVYLLGMAFGFAGLAQMAPTRADIERRQMQITSQGSSLSLLEALMAPPSGGRGERRP